MQDENQKPDYSFIMNQPGFEPTPPKRRPKGLMFVVIIVALLGVITIVGLFARRSTNVKQVATSEQAAQQVASTYFANLAQAKYADAHAMVSPTDPEKVLSEEVFVNTIGPLLNDTFDFSTCKITKTIEAGSAHITSVRCNYKGSVLQETMAVTTNTSNGTVKIVQVQNTDREKQG